MRASFTPALLLGMLVAGCSADTSTISAPPSSALSRGSDGPNLVERPFAGSCVVTFPAPPLPPPAILRQVDTGSCVLTQLGQTAFYGVQDINLAAGTQSGERTFTAANGDILRAVHSGVSAPIGPGLVGFVATLTFVGGTGRFEHATGQARGVGTANLITHTSTFTLDGRIAFDASDRGTSSSATSLRAASVSGPIRPIEGTSVSVPRLDFAPPAGRCPAAYPVLVTIDGSLQLSHLGRTDVVQSHCIDFGGPGSQPDFRAATATFTAANGDRVYATYTGTIVPILPPAGPPTEGTLSVQMTFTGGTGRFTGATGELSGTGVQVFNGAATLTYEGWIAY
jgi:hypothetical protein